jgi:signal transduction histidine kinase
MWRIRHQSFLKEPLRDVRAFKWWTRVAVSVAIAGQALIFVLVFDLSTLAAMFIFPTMWAISLLGIELAFAHGLRLARSGVYPVKLAVELGPLRGFEESCDGSAKIVGELLGADATVVAWIDQDLQELVPVAGAGFPERWLKTAPRLYLPESELLKHVRRGEVAFHNSTIGDPWFAGFGEWYSVAYVPLVSLDKVIGVLGLMGDRPSSELRDRRLLNSIGIAIGLSLDNARLYDQERERAERLQELARMKSDFLVTVSHELRTPLTSVKTAAEMLEEEELGGPDSPRAQLVQNIVRGANRLSTLVADLMSMARLDTRELQLDMQPVGVGEVVASACSLMYPLMIARHQTLDTGFETPGPTIVADRDRFEQILVNLLSNANRFAPAEGHISVRVRADDDEVIITVSDTGPGIPPEEQQHIFEAFYRGRDGGRRRVPGMGMGLAIAKSLTELHGGRIWLESGEGGSTFCVAVQRAAEPVVPARVRAGVV